MEMPIDVLRRFMSKVHREGECWVWHAGKDKDGYGIFALGHRKSVRAHRAAYEHFVGPIPKGLVLDHVICRRTSCVSPHHTEPVTVLVNTLRGVGPSAKNAMKIVCKNGHRLTPKNTYEQPAGRGCLTCRRERGHARYLANYIPAEPRTHCKHGHEYTADNTRPRHGNPRSRVCKTCEKERPRRVIKCKLH